MKQMNHCELVAIGEIAARYILFGLGMEARIKYLLNAWATA